MDDGSTDNTRQVIEPHLSLDNLSYFRMEENIGQPRAKNRGIRESRGKFIAFLDADDVWLPRKLEKQIPLFERNPDVGIVYCDDVCFCGGQKLPEVGHPPPSHEMSILSHSDCLAHDAAGYLYHRVRGTPFLSLEVASLIRQGKLKRSDGAKRLREELEAVSKYPRESMALLSEVCGQSERQILKRVSRTKLKRALRRLVPKVKT